MSLLLWGLVALVFAGHNYLTYAANHRPIELSMVISWSFAEWAPWVPLTPLVLYLVRASRPVGAGMMRAVSVLALVGLAIAALQVWLEYVVDQLAVLVAGNTRASIGVWLSDGMRSSVLDLAYLVPRKIGFSYATYCAVVIAGFAIEYRRLYVQRTVQAARLEGALLSAQLESLHAQLQPHFIFNTLNSIASLIPENPAAAEAIVESLSDLLRAAVREAACREIPLARELALLDRYLEIQQARFGGRLTIRREIPPALGPAIVPPMLLQPLMENAIRHGIVSRATGGTIVLRGGTSGGQLELVIEDDGPGFSKRGDRSGIGLNNVRTRLDRLYGTNAALAVGNREAGGAFASVRLPLQFATAAANADWLSIEAET